MLVLLDSGVIVRDFELKSTEFHVFLTSIPHTQNRLYVPQVVLDEVVGQAYKGAISAREDLLKARNKSDFNRLPDALKGQFPFSTPATTELETAAANYSKFLLQQFSAVGATFLPYPETAHEAVIARKSRGRKPFKPKGDKGYADTLVWESVLELATREAGQVALISTNTEDFAQGSHFHPDLLADCEERGIDRSRLLWFDSLERFNGSHLATELIDQARSKFLESELYRESSPEDILHGEFERRLIGMEVPRPRAVTLPTREYIQAVEEVECVNVWKVLDTESGERLIYADAEATFLVRRVSTVQSSWREHGQGFLFPDQGPGQTVLVNTTETERELVRRLVVSVEYTFDEERALVTSFGIRAIVDPSEPDADAPTH